MKKNRFKLALALYGDMINQEMDTLSGSPDSLLAKIMEYGVDGAAIRGPSCSKVLMPDYRIDPEALRIARCLFEMPLRSKNAIVARHVLRNLRTDRQRANLCECKEPTYRQRLSRGIKDLRLRYLDNVTF